MHLCNAPSTLLSKLLSNLEFNLMSISRKRYIKKLYTPLPFCISLAYLTSSFSSSYVYKTIFARYFSYVNMRARARAPAHTRAGIYINIKILSFNAWADKNMRRILVNVIWGACLIARNLTIKIKCILAVFFSQ
jgi:hypothetical protein